MEENPSAHILGSPAGPDPSALTTAQIIREIESLRQLVFARLGSIEQRAAEEHEDLVRVPTDVDRAVSSLKELIFTKLEAVDQRFEAVDVLRRESQDAASTAIAAALQAVKEAGSEQTKTFAQQIEKSESSLTRQIEAQATSTGTSLGALNAQVSDLKDRLTRFEGRSSGHGDTLTLAVAAFAILGVIGTLVFEIIRLGH